MIASPLDLYGRPLRNLRLSVTDRCNLRCTYCMPEAEYKWLGKDKILSFEEIAQITRLFHEVGVTRLRLTGGEPLLRRQLPDLIRLVRQEVRFDEITMTTNGIRLAAEAQSLRDAGLHRITVSLDTLKPSRYKKLNGVDAIADAVRGIVAARKAGFRKLKINTVIIKGVNDDELVDLIEFGKKVGAEVRFIEYMDVGGATRWSWGKVVSRQAILSVLKRHYGGVVTRGSNGSAPADQYELPDGTRFGVIASATTPFCSSCDRSRVTVDGMWYHCLYAKSGFNLRTFLRDGMSSEALKGHIRREWNRRRNRGAEERLLVGDRQALYPPAELQRDPHLEMHTRGG